jgi:hypothetical protein
MRRPWPALGRSATGNNDNYYIKSRVLIVFFRPSTRMKGGQIATFYSLERARRKGEM